MARIDLIGEDVEPDAEARSVAEELIRTRGEVSRPFQILLHAPTLAERVGELGHRVRTGSSLGDADRELVTLATGSAVGCDFIWQDHVEPARASGLSDETLDGLRRRRSLGARETTLVAFVDELCRSGAVSGPTFEAAGRLLDTRELVELSTTVGYYTMLARVMGAFEAC
jgi:4-carboxymuconolactone decarboxylase